MEFKNLKIDVRETLKYSYKYEMQLPEKMEATAAIMNEMTTPGPATFRATIPATKYIPVPTQDPTPRDVRSRVVRHFCKRKKCTAVIKFHVSFLENY